MTGCPRCGGEVTGEFAFCPRCGRKLPRACAACGFVCEPDFTFCPRCGVALSSDAGVPAPPPASEAVRPARPSHPAGGAGRDADRRQVTILFADLSGFTTLSERLDPEDVRTFQSALFEALAQSIARYDGFVEKFVGDAVLAVFGAPVAHENDPERALDASLDMLKRSAALNEQWGPRLGQTVALHVAVHTGPVVAGSLGEAAGGAYAVTGDTVNTTARLLAAAQPGTILVSEATHALTRHRFAFEPAGTVALRGKSEPIIVHRLTGVHAEPRSARGLSALGLTAPLIGRKDELEQLIGAFERMQRGRAQVVSIVGEVGTGKSRLIAEMLARLESDGRLAGTVVRRAACTSLGERTYGVFGALFSKAYDIEPEDSLDLARQKLATGLRALGAGEAEVDAVAPALSYVLGVDEERRPDVEPEQLKRQIALAARLLVERRLDQAPVLVLVEDVHWADAASVDLLQHVVDQLADRRLMMLFSHRPDAPPPLVSRASQTVIRLAPLSEPDTRTLVASVFGAPARGESLAGLQELVARRSGGNPFFVEEILRTLVSKGELIRQGEHWAYVAVSEATDVPATLHGLLLSRIDRLPTDVRRLLQEAAVVGAEFDASLLGDIATDSAAGVTGLDGLAEADLIRPVGLGRYRFTHALVHEVVYENLLVSRRTELHGRVARALERAVGSAPERLQDLESLGHHWSLSADKLKGARYLLAAGDWARAVYANDDAIRHYQRAIDRLAEVPGASAESREAHERLADLLALTGRRAEALAHYETVLAETGTASPGAMVGRIYRKIGNLHWDAGDRERAGACFASGLASLGNEGDSIERAHLFQEMGRLAFRTGDNALAISWAERALVEAGSHGGSGREREAAAMRAQAYNTLGVALARTGRLNEAIQQIEHSIELAQQAELLQAACRGYTNLGVLYASVDPRRSIETCLRGLETAKKVGDLGFQSRLYANLAVAYCALTDRCEAEGVVAARTAIDLDRRLGLYDHLAVPLIVLGQIHQCHGDHALAFVMYEEARDLAERVGEPQLLFPCYDGLATLYLDSGNQAMAEMYLAKAQEVCERAGLEPDALMVLPFLC